MAVVTAAVSAIAAAVATTTAATVATAVVATATLIGTVGIAVTAVGMITKNDSLLKAGKIMGYVGLAGNIAGWGVGMASMGANEFATHVGELYKTAWDQGVGSWFSGGEPVTNAQGGTGMVGTTSTDPIAAAPQAGINPNAPSTSMPGWKPPDMVGNSTGLNPPTTPTDMSTAVQAGPMDTPLAGATSTPPAGVTPTAEQSLAQQTAAATQSPVAPMQPIAQDVAGSIAQAGQPGAGTVLAPTATGPFTSPLAQSAWDKLPDYVKYSLLTTGAQGASGMAAGWFQGLSAEERLALEKEIANRNEAQRQLENRNAAYAPRLSFRKPTGIIGAAGRPA